MIKFRFNQKVHPYCQKSTRSSATKPCQSMTNHLERDFPLVLTSCYAIMVYFAAKVKEIFFIRMNLKWYQATLTLPCSLCAMHLPRWHLSESNRRNRFWCTNCCLREKICLDKYFILTFVRINLTLVRLVISGNCKAS